MFFKLYVRIYILWNIFLFKKKNILLGNNFRIRGPIKLSISKSGMLSIGNGFEMASGLMLNPLGRNMQSMIRIDENAEITIGNATGMSCVCLWAKKRIVIGNNVKLGADVIVFDSDMHSLDFLLRRDYRTDSINAKSIPISIGDDVFVGARSIICKGVSIGNRSIIAAGSVVVANIPEDEIWGGNPAKFIKKN